MRDALCALHHLLFPSLFCSLIFPLLASLPPHVLLEIPSHQALARGNLASSMRVANPLTGPNARAGGGNRMVSTRLAPGVDVSEAAEAADDAEFADTVQNPMAPESQDP